MSSAILGYGLVTPVGLTPREHAFYVPAMLPAPATSPFVGPKGKPVGVERCPWLGATAATAGRLTALALQAARTALAPLAGRDVRLGLLLCTEQVRPGLSDEDVVDLAAALGRVFSPVFTLQVRGAAGPFGAIDRALERSKTSEADGLLVIAVDSFVSLDAVNHYVVGAPGHWIPWGPIPSEGSAAILLASPSAARQRGVAPIATLQEVAVEVGTSRDDNDEIVDGVALTQAMRRVGTGRVHYVFGQVACGSLRPREWLLAMGRNGDRFRDGHLELDLESLVGALGASAGLANLVYGIAGLRHRTLDSVLPRDGPFLAWHITRDGARGVAKVRVEGAA